MTAENWIQLIKIIVWPVVVVFAILVFKGDFEKILERLKKLKFWGGNEIEFYADVKKFEKNVEQRRQEVSGMVFSMEENEKKSMQLS